MEDFDAMRERFAGYQLLPEDERSPEPDPAVEAVWRAGLDAIQAAKAAAEEAFAGWQAAEAEFHSCPVWVERARAARMPEPCDCHWPALVAAYETYQAAKAEIPKAIERFKTGEVE